tara:strand:- start:2765 stop:3772 length:1008 start_codon:yes stop_codon:yes gene_type:complete
MMQAQREFSQREGSEEGRSSIADESENLSQTQQEQIVRNLSDGDMDGLRDLISGFSTQANNAGSFTTDEATRLSRNASEAAIQTTLKQGFGDVAAAGTNAGAYDSTTQGQIASQVSADAARAGAGQELEMQQLFAGLRKEEGGEATGVLAQLMATLAGAQSSTTGTGTQLDVGKGTEVGTTSNRTEDVVQGFTNTVTDGSETTAGTNESTNSQTSLGLAEKETGSSGLLSSNNVTTDLNSVVANAIGSGGEINLGSNNSGNGKVDANNVILPGYIGDANPNTIRLEDEANPYNSNIATENNTGAANAGGDTIRADVDSDYDGESDADEESKYKRA